MRHRRQFLLSLDCIFFVIRGVRKADVTGFFLNVEIGSGDVS